MLAPTNPSNPIRSSPMPSHDALDKSNVPSVMDDSPHGKAVAAVNAMSLAERVGQLVMAPLYAGSDPSSLQDLIVNQHVGSGADHRQLEFGNGRCRRSHIRIAIVCAGQ